MKISHESLMVTLDGVTGLGEDELVEALSGVLASQPGSPEYPIDLSRNDCEFVADTLRAAAETSAQDPSDFHHSPQEYEAAAEIWAAWAKA